VKASATATFKVVASGTAPLSYQWFKNGNQIGGATAATYLTPPTTDGDSGSYFMVEVSNSVNSIYSNPAQLTVEDPPVIYQQPTNLTITVPGVASFFVYCGGSGPMSFQWYKNGSPISGANQQSYSGEEVTTADNGAVFKVIVKNAVGTATSTGATLTVKPSNAAGTYPIVGNWSGTATVTDADGSKSTSQVVAVFSQTTYSLTGTLVYTDDSGTPTYGAGVGSLNGQNVYTVVGDDSGAINIVAGFNTSLLTLTGVAVGADGSGGSGTLTLSADKKSLTGHGSSTDGGAVTWSLTREN
jgi:hypothetical protein